MFDQELNFFIRNQEDLVKKYAGKALAISGAEISAVYNTPLEAFLEIQRKNQLGKVMIQVCRPGPEAYTVTIS